MMVTGSDIHESQRAIDIAKAHRERLIVRDNLDSKLM